MTWPAPPPALLAAIAILENEFPGVLISPRSEKTPVRPGQFIRVTRIGGYMGTAVTDTPRILVECWAPFDDLEEMTGRARAALRNAKAQTFAGVKVRGWFNEYGPTDLPDPDVTDLDRWQFHGDLAVSIN